jgi:putative component of membrane protein insertase Oxa1/YidC/SpoIIIJ protein YidD
MTTKMKRKRGQLNVISEWGLCQGRICHCHSLGGSEVDTIPQHLRKKESIRVRHG